MSDCKIMPSELLKHFIDPKENSQGATLPRKTEGRRKKWIVRILLTKNQSGDPGFYHGYARGRDYWKPINLQPHSRISPCCRPLSLP